MERTENSETQSTMTVGRKPNGKSRLKVKSSSFLKHPPVLKQYAALWTLSHQPLQSKEWSMEQKVIQAKKAGFDALGGFAFRGAPAEIYPLCQKHGLDYIYYTDANQQTYREKLEVLKGIKPARINVQFADHDTLPKKAVAGWLKMDALAEKMGLDMDLEVHRDTCTETPEKTYEIADLYKKATGKMLRFCWDFSHIAVVKHISHPYAERLLERPELIQLARQFHFRPFNGHHCQVPATDGKGQETADFKIYLQFVDAIIACWMKGARGGEVVYACPEFGPIGVNGYGLSSFPNVWKDAIYMRAKTNELWEANLRRFGE